MWSWENGTATCKRIRPFPQTMCKKNSLWIKDLNVKVETINILEKNICRTSFDINRSNIFLCLSPKAKEIKAKQKKKRERGSERVRERPNGLYSLLGSSVHGIL